MKQKGEWRYTKDEEGDFIFYHSDRYVDDAAFTVYLPTKPRKRRWAIEAVVRALNAAPETRP